MSGTSATAGETLNVFRVRPARCSERDVPGGTSDGVERRRRSGAKGFSAPAIASGSTFRDGS